ncbi:hypothetical protein BGZ46_004821 [Entomortierella lignicola]|nr:hypothetical protein BGZ46_004821 [Entomortierella lignicola]
MNLPSNVTTTAPIHPLNIPEILSIVASFLADSKSIQNFAACTCVSTSFHTAFTPFLYRRLNLRHKYPPSFQSSLQKYGHYVHILDLDIVHLCDIIPNIPTLAIPNLRDIRELNIFQSNGLNSSFRDVHHEIWRDIATLIEQNQELTHVSIRFLSRVLFPAVVFEALAKVPLLHSLNLNGAIISDRVVRGGEGQQDQNNNIEAFMRACRSVQVLGIDYTTFSPENLGALTSPFYNPSSLWNNPHLVFKNITSFTFFGRSDLTLVLFSHCLEAASHTLRRLTWNTEYPTRYRPTDNIASIVAKAIVKAVNSSTPRGLESLESLHLWDGMPFSDQEIAEILDALPNPLKELIVPESDFDKLSLKALLNSQNRASHCTTLQHLDLGDCPYVTFDMKQQIRHACSNLKVFLCEVQE